MFKGYCFPETVILQAVYFKLRFGLCYQDVEELLLIRGVKVDHAPVQRWVFKFPTLIEQNFRYRKKPIGNRLRMDETYVKLHGKCWYLYRAVDKQGKTIDFLLTKIRRRKDAQRFLIKAIEGNGKPTLININKSTYINKNVFLVFRTQTAKVLKTNLPKYIFLN